MSGPLLRLVDLRRSPEFRLAELLALLPHVKDGYTSQRIDVPGNVWNLEGAGGYSVEVLPEYQCGFSGEADAPILITVVERVQETEGASMKMQTRKSVRSSVFQHGEKQSYAVLEWRVQVALPSGKGEGVNDHLGVAALVAYLRAWGVLE
ncbi:hypothetical protein CBQ26_09200 [Deinococcus indicus]|uniref:Uncharacterized protein n=1 Tax=Deinococcus indicus TaxID=223556 RepID=A0A2D0A7Z3_9DEIO|nr:hypothetical protein [Deinococcus indicus]OWL96543.1 hypothetical protein CBQ26_09200 [Deinococcus indicus]